MKRSTALFPIALALGAIALAPGQSRAANLVPVVSFCTQTNCTDGANPFTGLIVDAKGNLFGTTEAGGANGQGTVFQIANTHHGYASTPTILYSFCAQTNCADGEEPFAELIADADGNLFGTTTYGGAHQGGTVFEVTGSGFVPLTVFAGTPWKANCVGQSVSALAKQYGGLNDAATALGFDSVGALQGAIGEYCEA